MGGRYAYQICDSATRRPVRTVCKVRGITLNYSTLQQVNFDVIKDMVQSSDVVAPVTAYTEKIKRKNVNRVNEGAAGTTPVAVVTEPEDKTYRIFF